MTQKNLVVYYSFEGSTRLIAQTIAEALEADLLECKPIKDIKSKGFMKYAWGGRQVIFKKHPQLEPFPINPNDYDLIIIGTPVWAFNYAPAIRSFASQANLTKKNIGVFCCHEGAIGKTFEDLKKVFTGNTIIGEMDFLNVPKHTQENIEKAKNWANTLK